MKKVDYTLYFITNSDGYDEETFLRKVKGAHKLVKLWVKIVLLELLQRL